MKNNNHGEKTPMALVTYPKGNASPYTQKFTVSTFLFLCVCVSTFQGNRNLKYFI